MHYGDSFSRQRTLILDSADKETVFRNLIDAIVRDAPGFTAAAILDRVNQREALFSTRMADEIAIPHATIPGFPGTLAAVGLCRNPVVYDAQTDKPVQLIILIVGDGNMHLKVLAWLAERLRQPQRLNAILNAADPETVFQRLTGHTNKPAPYPAGGLFRKQDSQLILDKARDLARQLDISTLCYHVASADNILSIIQAQDLRVFMVVHSESARTAVGNGNTLLVPFKNLNRINQVELALLYLISAKHVGHEEKILSVLGPPDTGELDTIIVSDTSHYRYMFPLGGEDKPADLEQQVFMRMLQIANELAMEGREGKPVGTLYVMGDSERVGSFCQQMVVNPFGGYREEDRNVLDPGLKATIKEFSKIDGACLIRGDGVLLSCGAFIKAGGGGAHHGYGARHTAAANISAVTDALSIAVSESTRRVSVFKNGVRIMCF